MKNDEEIDKEEKVLKPQPVSALDEIRFAIKNEGNRKEDYDEEEEIKYPSQLKEESKSKRVIDKDEDRRRVEKLK